MPVVEVMFIVEIALIVEIAPIIDFENKAGISVKNVLGLELVGLDIIKYPLLIHSIELSVGSRFSS